MKKGLLLFTIGLFAMCFAQNSYAQNLLTESFDDLTTFPPTGWIDSIYVSTNSFADPHWDQGALPNYPYPNTTPHSGAGMAWYNSSYNNNTDYAELGTPQINIPTGTGTTVLSFWVYNYNSGFFNPNDELDVYIDNAQDTISSNSVLLGFVQPFISSVTTGWVQYRDTIPAGTTGAQYIIFKGISNEGYDILLDDVSVDFIQPCTSAPLIGVLNTVTACSGVSFTLYPSDTAAAFDIAGLAYHWQSSTNGANWIPIPTATGSSYVANITTPTYFRAIITCTASGVADTTPAELIGINPYYVCYCVDSSMSPTYEGNVGNVVIESNATSTIYLNNGNPNPITGNAAATNNYTDYTGLTPTNLYLDSLYRFIITQTEASASGWAQSMVNVYIDYNQDGIYQSSELMLTQITQSASSPSVTDTFRIPATAPVGITGMRVILNPYVTTPTDPCAINDNGETEDYLVNISYDPCNGPVSAGAASATDTTLCPGLGYSFTLSDVTHERNQGDLTWSWEQSPDNGVTWGAVPNTINRDTVTLIFNLPVWYRMRITCNNANATTYSNVIKINSNPGYACYCYSEAIGGKAFDSSDIGAFGIGKYLFDDNSQLNNAHLNNPGAARGHTDYSPYVMDLAADSTYHVLAYQVLKSAIHADAKVTMFIDYNNNQMYDIPEERVWTAYTTADSFFLTTDITIPHNVVPNVHTGMRIIINDNVSPNVPSDDACGSYTSGETEDFVVVIHDSATAAVSNIQNIQDLLMYPNPTNGKVKVFFNATRPVKQMTMRVSNITGQQVMVSEYSNIGSQFSTDLDLTSQARGMYFVEFIMDGERTVRKLTLE